MKEEMGLQWKRRNCKAQQVWILSRPVSFPSGPLSLFCGSFQSLFESFHFPWVPPPSSGPPNPQLSQAPHSASVFRPLFPLPSPSDSCPSLMLCLFLSPPPSFGPTPTSSPCFPHPPLPHSSAPQCPAPSSWYLFLVLPDPCPHLTLCPFLSSPRLGSRYLLLVLPLPPLPCFPGSRYLLLVLPLPSPPLAPGSQYLLLVLPLRPLPCPLVPNTFSWFCPSLLSPAPWFPVPSPGSARLRPAAARASGTAPRGPGPRPSPGSPSC